MSTNNDSESENDAENDIEQLAEELTAAMVPVIAEYLDERESQQPEPDPVPPDWDAIKAFVLDVIDERGPVEGEGITREDAIEIAKEHGGIDPETKARLDTALGRTEAALGELENKMARRVGPSSPSGDYHTHPGWGLHFTLDRPYTFGTTKVDGLTSGTVNVELFEYDGDVGDLVAEKEVRVPRGGESVTVDLEMDEIPPGEYLLTRDYENTPPQDDRVSLRRQEGYALWDEDSGVGLALHGSGHNDFSDNENWYYFFDLGVRPQRVGETEDE